VPPVAHGKALNREAFARSVEQRTHLEQRDHLSRQRDDRVISGPALFPVETLHPVYQGANDLLAARSCATNTTVQVGVLKKLENRFTASLQVPQRIPMAGYKYAHHAPPAIGTAVPQHAHSTENLPTIH
jgi:hypothetical protein